MKRFLISAAGFAGLGVLLGGIVLWRKLGAPSYVTTRERNPYGPDDDEESRESAQISLNVARRSGLI